MIAALNARFYALLAQHGIVPGIGPHVVPIAQSTNGR
jgi:hypothetical protein